MSALASPFLAASSSELSSFMSKCASLGSLSPPPTGTMSLSLTMATLMIPHCLVFLLPFTPIALTIACCKSPFSMRLGTLRIVSRFVLMTKFELLNLNFFSSFEAILNFCSRIVRSCHSGCFSFIQPALMKSMCFRLTTLGFLGLFSSSLISFCLEISSFDNGAMIATLRPSTTQPAPSIGAVAALVFLYRSPNS